MLRISVIVSTCNAEEWLEKVLFGYSLQTHRGFEVIVADDGSRAATADLVARHAPGYPVPLRHVRNEDDGYRRQEVLNMAIPAAAHDYVLFTDGDCIPRRDFVASHARLAEPGRFLSGGYCKLGMELSKRITLVDIAAGRCFEPDWLQSFERLAGTNRRKLGASPVTARVLDAITPAGATFDNCNSSAWKADLLAVNGYDERMKYGGPDRELGERLENAGIRGKQVRHKAICLHLDHARDHKTAESVQANLAIRAQTRAERRTWTPHGIVKQEAPLPASTPPAAVDVPGALESVR
ncbi:MAG TPA: glycosyltransferase family 2 protein [Luteimonas sp.]|nr:glycosyltransferase family 2 protein [Luteimonas sp.]HRO26641.1 glycosyltransferase family 2 protein [Luteimonas sp.]HRP72898.1 glycosyltransferase family 2 protein [Luteimonas sp.]